MQEFDWQTKFKDKIKTASAAMKLIKSGNSVFIGTGCAQPQHLVNALVQYSDHIYDAHIVHLLTMGAAPYVDTKFREKFKMNSFFIADNVRDALQEGIGDYTPIFLSEIPAEFETGRIPVDVALISVAPPDVNGLCSLGVSVDIVQSAASNARYVIAQVNANMPRTHGNSFIHVNNIDVLVPCDEPIIEIPIAEPDETLRRIGQNVARLVEDGSTIECGIGRIPQALAEYLVYKKDLGIHTEMFSDWILELIECGCDHLREEIGQSRQDRRQLLYGLQEALRLYRQQSILRILSHRVRQRRQRDQPTRQDGRDQRRLGDRSDRARSAPIRWGTSSTAASAARWISFADRLGAEGARRSLRCRRRPRTGRCLELYRI